MMVAMGAAVFPRTEAIEWRDWVRDSGAKID
jgi:hypothetical protein